jgi:Rne/Rng family ribonuclease
MSERLFIAGSPEARLIIAWGGEGLAEIHRDDARHRSAIGRIHLGRIAAIDRKLGAAFVEIGGDRPGLLPLRGRVAGLAEGERLIVQVRRDGSGAKGPRLSADVGLPGHWLEFRPAGGEAIAASSGSPAELAVAALALPGEAWRIRPTAAGATPEQLAAEMAPLRERWAAICAKADDARPPALLAAADDPVFAMLRDRPAKHWSEIVLDHRASGERLQAACAALPLPPERIVYRPRREWLPEFAEMREQLLEALEDDVTLPGGGWLRIETGSAATLIDVNSGDATSGAGSPEAAFLRINQAAARAIARQLRLRNIGGLVVVDFIDLESRRGRRSVTAALREALAEDPAPWSIGEMSARGLVELTRRRRGQSLREAFTEACPHCGGSGRAMKRDPLLA